MPVSFFRFTPYDRAQAIRAGAFSLLGIGLSLVIVIATDEGQPWCARLGMTAGISPLAALLGALCAVRLSASRGEVRALEALGARPLRIALGSVLGGSAIGQLGPALLGMAGADLAPLFPKPIPAHQWVANGSSLCELSLGMCLGGTGPDSLSLVERTLPPPVDRPLSVLPWIALALAGACCPTWIVLGGRSFLRRAAVGAVAVLSTIVSFHVVAARQAPEWVLLAGPLVLMVDAALPMARRQKCIVN